MGDLQLSRGLMLLLLFWDGEPWAAVSSDVTITSFQSVEGRRPGVSSYLGRYEYG